MSNHTGTTAHNPGEDIEPEQNSGQTSETAQTQEPVSPPPAETAREVTVPSGPTRIEVPDQLSREQLKDLYDTAVAVVREGTLLKGRIAQLSRDVVMVDIGYKSEGTISADEFGSSLDQYNVGDEIDVYLEKLEDADGLVVLSKVKADRQIKWEETMRRCKEGEKVSGRVMRKVRGGLIVDIGMDAFLPASQVDIKHVAHVEDYIGQTLEFKLIKINPERRNVVVSRRELLEEERARNRAKLIEEIEEGQVRQGMVKNITDFGAFIDLFGLDGLLHITDMSWGRVGHPSEILDIGQMVRVKVLHFDRERQRIALGLKQLEPNPWDNIEDKYPVGSIVRGRIVSLQPYGAFIELARGVEGLIHISEMSWTRRISHPSEVLSEGDIVEAMVLSIKPDEQKISLGIKQTEFNPWTIAEEKYPQGTRVKGRVRNITSYGAFVELEEGIDGLIHISDLSWTRKINHPSEVVRKGDDIECVVLAVNPDEKKITLGLKQLEADPWDTVEQTLRVGDVVEGSVSKIADFGAFVTLPSGIECLVHKSQVSDTPVDSVEAVLKAGDEIKAKVVRIDLRERKIALSIREYLHDAGAAEAAGGEYVPTRQVRPEDLPKPSAPSALGEHLDEALEAAGMASRAPEPESPAQEPASPAEPAAETPAAETPAAETPTAETPAAEGEAAPSQPTADAETTEAPAPAAEAETAEAPAEAPAEEAEAPEAKPAPAPAEDATAPGAAAPEASAETPAEAPAEGPVEAPAEGPAEEPDEETKKPDADAPADETPVDSPTDDDEKPAEGA